MCSVMSARRRRSVVAAVIVVALSAGCSSSTSSAKPAPGSTKPGRVNARCGSQPDLFRGKTVAAVTVKSHQRLAPGVDVSYVRLTGRVVQSDHLAAGSTTSWVQANSVVTRSKDDSVPDGGRVVVLLTAPGARRFATETFTEIAGRTVAFGVVDPNVRDHLRTASLDAVYAFLVACARAT
jgi:hypothetical protein